MKITELSIKRPILILVFLIIIVIGGFYAYNRLKYELLPGISTPYVAALTAYPGASPADIENTVSKPIEEKTSGLNNVKKVTSFSSNDLSIVLVQFEQDANHDLATQDVQRAIDQVKTDLPPVIKTPVVIKYSLSDLPVMRIGIMANISETELYQLIQDNIKNRLMQIPSVGGVTIAGGNEKEIKIYLNKLCLEQYHISVLQVQEALKVANVDIPAGNIKTSDATIGVRIAGKIIQTELIKNIPVTVLANGRIIKMGDVARIFTGQKETSQINRINGHTSIGLIVFKQSNANSVELADNLRKELKNIISEYKNEGLKYSIAQDSSEFTLEAAKAVNEDLILAIILVALVMLIFLHSLRNAIIVMIAIPASLFSAYICMFFMNFSLNIMTLLAMSLVIGILVDDSIVVLESIQRHLNTGKDRRTATLDGRNEIGFSAVSITLVDVVVFLPMAFVSGLVGSIVKEYSFVVVVSTLTSLLVSFTLTPMIASRFGKSAEVNSNSLFSRFNGVFEEGFVHLQHNYSCLLSWSLNHRKTIITLCICLLLGSLLLVFREFIGTEFIPPSDKGEVSLGIIMPAGTKLEYTDSIVRVIEAKVKAMPEIQNIFTTTGYFNDGYIEQTKPNVAQLTISAVSSDKRKKSVKELAREIKTITLEQPGVTPVIDAVGILGVNGAPLQILVNGDNRDSVMAAANILKKITQSIPGIINIRLSSQPDNPTFEIALDKEKAILLGLDPTLAGLAIRVAINGFDESQLHESNAEVPIHLQFNPEDVNTLDKLEKLTFVNSTGENIFFGQFASVSQVNSPSILERRNKAPSVYLFAYLSGRPSGDAGNDIKEALKKKPLPSGIHLDYEGDLEYQSNSFERLGIALIAAFILVYLIMVALYNSFVYPFIVLFSIPVALIGAFYALSITGKSLNVFSIMGLIMMMGLVAKNAILLVDRTNTLVHNGKNIIEALMEAGDTRLRPILMTTLAMVAGMIPLAISQGAGSEWKSSVATVLIGGLLSSMFLTLVLVPVVYFQIHKLTEKLSGFVNRKFRLNRQTQIISVIFILFTFTSLPSSGQEKKSITISDALSIALQQNPEIVIANLEKEKSGYIKDEAVGALLPTISASANYSRYINSYVLFIKNFTIDPVTGEVGFNGPLSPIPVSAKNSFTATVDAWLPVINFEYYRTIELAMLKKKQSDYELEILKAEKAYEVKKLCYSIIFLEANKKFMDTSLQRSIDNLKEARSRQSLGLLNETDTLQLFLSVQNYYSGLTKLKNNYHQAVSGLNILLNTDSLTLSDTLAYSHFDLDTTQFTRWIGTSPTIQKYAIQAEMSKKKISLEKSKNLPGLSIISQYSQISQADNFKIGNYKWANPFYIGLQLNIPLFSGFRSNSRIKQAKVEYCQSIIQKRYIIKSMLLDVRTRYETIRELQLQIDVQNKSLAAATRLFEQANDRWEHGFLKMNELLDMELTVYQARIAWLQSVYEYQIAIAELGKVFGKLN